jgi:hypothetical protein
LNKPEFRRIARELEVLVATGTEFAQHQVVGLHAPARVLGHSDWNGTCLPVGRREGGRAQADALGVVPVLDVEVARFTQDEGASVCELLVIVGRDHIDVARGRQGPGGRIRQCGQDRGGADDVEVVQVEAPADLEDHVLELVPLHGGSGGPHRTEDAFTCWRVHQRGEGRFLAQVVGLSGSLGERAQQRWQWAIQQLRPAIVVDPAVRVHPPEHLQTLTRNRAQRWIACQSLGHVLVQASAAQRWQVDPIDGVIARGTCAALDHDTTFGAKAVQDTPQRRLADPRTQAMTDLGLAQAAWLHQEQLQDLVADAGGHGGRPE